jgi:hypothetical protein
VTTPPNERQVLDQELAELPSRIAAYQRELAETAATKTRRKFLDWQIRNAKRQLAYIGVRLAALKRPRG